MEKQVLRPYQMIHLKNLGLDINDASLCWSKFINDSSFKLNIENKDEFEKKIAEFDTIYTVNDYTIIPAYTVQDITDKLPKSLLWKEENKYVFLSIYFDFNCSTYVYETTENDILISFIEDKQLYTAYKMLCWCVENDYIKTNKNM